MATQANNSNNNANLDLLQRRDRSLFVFEQKSWSDFRAWIASCLVHTTLLVVIALLWRPQTRGTSGELDRPVGIAHQTNPGDEYLLEGGSGGASSSSKATFQAVPLAFDNTTGPPLSVENILAELVGNQSGANDSNTGQTGTAGIGLASGGGSSTSGLGRGPGTGKKTKTNFFGVEGSGSSFVYVVDRSDSMNAYEAAPLRNAKRELLKSLESLNDYNQFQIVFYNDSLSPLSGTMIFATDTNKRRASGFIRAMPGDGGTAHLPALKQALAMAPEVLFFLTDADDPRLSLPQLDDIQRRADLTRTTIHSIQFNVGPATNDGGWIRNLAVMNRGTYKYVDVTSVNRIQGQ